jgi:hypothetical protein
MMSKLNIELIVYVCIYTHSERESLVRMCRSTNVSLYFDHSDTMNNEQLTIASWKTIFLVAVH